MKRAAQSIHARAHRVWMPLIESIFTGKQPDERVLAEARLIEKQLKQRQEIQSHRMQQSATSLPLFEGVANA